MDAGAGDGRQLLREARADPRALFIAVDPVASAMADSARRSAAKPVRGGCANIVWAVSSIEAWPAEAGNLAELVTVRYPWGSLLRGVLGRDPNVLAALAGMLKRGGRMAATISLTDRDGVEAAATGELCVAYARAGLELIVHRSATPDEMAATATTWARKLRVGRSRPATRIEAVRRC